MRRNAAIYTRVSTPGQADDGVSLEIQREQLVEYCERTDLTVVEIIVDAGVSGYRPMGDRPGGKRLLELLKSGAVDTVVAWDLTRLWRNVVNGMHFVEAWTKQDVGLYLRDMGGQPVDTRSAIGKAMLGVMVVFGQMVRDQTSEKTKVAMAYKKAKNEFLGGLVPYGYKLGQDGKTLAVDHLEQECIALARDLQSLHGLSLRKICAELTDRGYRPRASSTWYASTLRGILKADAA